MSFKGMVILVLVLLSGGTCSAGDTLFKDFRFNGSGSINWRNISPRMPGFEYQIQNQVYLADLYFGAEGKINKKHPLVLEFQIPTASYGRLALYRFSTAFEYENFLKFEIGKLLVPFGHYNELYRTDQFLSVTRPLLYASPDSLDLTLRLNSPRPPFSAGYADIGGRLSYYPHSKYLPSELTLYVVNGFSETNNRLRTFPNSGRLNVEPVPISGVNMDFGHLNNNLADNNNSKAPGGRVAFALGDLKIPFPVAEGIELNGIRLGFSGMGGRYDLEDAIAGQDYRVYGSDLVFKYGNFSFTGEYVYSETDFRMALADSNGNVNFAQNTDWLPGGTEINKGYYLQLGFPISESPFIGERLLGILALNRLERDGPRTIFSNNTDPVSKMPVAAFSNKMERLITVINKYTVGLNLQIHKDFLFKTEYSYWDIKVPAVNGAIQTDVTQTAFSCVFSF